MTTLAILSALVILAAAPEESAKAPEEPAKSGTAQIVDKFLEGPNEAPAGKKPPAGPATPPAPAAALVEQTHFDFCTALQRVISETTPASPPGPATPLIPNTSAEILPTDGYVAELERTPRHDVRRRTANVALAVSVCLPGWETATGLDGEVFLLQSGQQSVEIQALTGGVNPRTAEEYQQISIIVNRRWDPYAGNRKRWKPPAQPKDLCAALERAIEAGPEAFAGVQMLKSSIVFESEVEYDEYGDPLPVAQSIEPLFWIWTSTLIPTGAREASVENHRGDLFHRAVFSRWALVDGRPSPDQVDEIVAALRGLTAEVARCLPTPEWTIESFAPEPGSAGAVHFNRAKANVRVVGSVGEREASAEVYVRNR